MSLRWKFPPPSQRKTGSSLETASVPTCLPKHKENQRSTECFDPASCIQHGETTQARRFVSCWLRIRDGVEVDAMMLTDLLGHAWSPFLREQLAIGAGPLGNGALFEGTSCLLGLKKQNQKHPGVLLKYSLHIAPTPTVSKHEPVKTTTVPCRPEAKQPALECWNLPTWIAT